MLVFVLTFTIPDISVLIVSTINSLFDVFLFFTLKYQTDAHTLINYIKMKNKVQFI